MKNTILSGKQADFLESLIVKHGAVVSAQQILAAAEDRLDRQQTHNLIQRLVKNGWLVRIKRGLYAISDLSSRGFMTVSPYAVARLLVEKSYVSFEAALSYHGMFDQLVSTYVSIAQRQFRSVEIHGVKYRFIKTQAAMYTGFEEVNVNGQQAHIATAEKALVDLVHFRKSTYAVDLLLEKLQEHQTDLDFDRLHQYLSRASLLAVKTFGLSFDLLGFNSDGLQHMLSGKQTTHSISDNKGVFNAKWRLYHDKYFDRYKIG